MERHRTLWQLIALRARQSPDTVFLRDEAGQTLGYGAYHDRAERVAAALAEEGIGADSTVAWQLPNWQEALVLAAALARLGARQVPMLPILRLESVAFICGQVGAQLLITPKTWKGHDYAAMAAQVRERLPQLALLAVDSSAAGGAGLPESRQSLPPLPTSGEDPVRWVFFTSGTTAEPKGALHSDDSLIATGFGMVAVLELAADDVVPLVFPFTHIGGFSWLVSFLLTGCECLLVETFSGTIVPWMREHGVTVAGAGVVFAQTYLKEQREQPGEPILPRLRLVTGGGSTKPPPLHEEVKVELDCGGFVSGYGLTECPIAVMNTVRDPDDRLAHTEGRPLPGMQVRIKSPDGRVLGPGEQGEIWLRGPHQCRGYVDASLNASAFDAEGFLASGDLGQLDAEGWLTVTGRIKDIIIRKGENISARKVEDALYQHPAIAELAVIALPDAERGELACAVVVLRGPSEAPSLAALAEFGLQKGLLKQELPERLEILAELPRNPSGKILKEQLKRDYAESGPA